MAQLMVALIGPGKGPQVPLHGHPCILRLSGMTHGNVLVQVDDKYSLLIETEGNHELPSGNSVCVEYFGSARTLIAEIIRKD